MNTIPRERPRTRQDKRALWENSPELRESVRADLTEWGKAQKGGFPDLGYPREQPFSITPSKAPPSHDPDKVDAISDTLTMWTLIQREVPDIEKRANMLRLLLILKTHFVSDAPAESKAKRFKVSRSSFWRLVDESMFRFWVLHY